MYQPPTKCPACGEDVSKIEGEVAYYCVNPGCSAQLVRNIEHFVSRATLDIEGLGIKIVEQLVAEGLVKDVADLYTLSKEDLLSLEGFGEKKANNLVVAINSSKQRPLDKLIFALGIRGVGEVVSTSLANKFYDLDSLSIATKEELAAIEGIGPNIAEAIVNWFLRFRNQAVLEKLKNVGMWPVYKRSTSEEYLPLENLTFVVTGMLENYSRAEIKERIIKAGGKVTGSVSKNTNYLVAGENPGSKYQRAETLGIQILTLDELENLLENGKYKSITKGEVE